ncbi:hypothetical protein [Nocardioides acrostichi]|uniref:Uncharacterized protein n=1 Tax=Nocardioides acrostichi TaxID=2784339 RepID=A0A930UZV2_9ACTN|nr:hypothetical protein [Nocardioides acrostichi]MBF4161444.1 hypothetical protein [Nocardioides acrostichi]
MSHLYVGATSQEARDTFYPYYRTYVPEGRGAHLDRALLETMAGPDGPLVVGSVGEVTDKIAKRRDRLGIDRFLGKADLGGLPRHLVTSSVERLGRDGALLLRG